MEICARRADKSEGWFEGRFYRQPAEPGVPVEIICVFTDISQLKHKELGLYHAAHCDPLTGLYNRTRFTQLAEQALAAATAAPFAFVMLDLDFFKQINDTKGHVFGDEILCAVGTALRGVLREQDVIARLGGDEFAMLLQGVSNAQALLRRMEEVRKAVADEGLSRHGTQISCSLGAALAPAQGRDFFTIYRGADRALYLAKESGKNCCRVLADHSDRAEKVSEDRQPVMV